jgi:hypothetical protein
LTMTQLINQLKNSQVKSNYFKFYEVNWNDNCILRWLSVDCILLPSKHTQTSI